MPSEKVIATIAELVGEELGKSLVLSYCATLFPRQRTLFQLPAWDVLLDLIRSSEEVDPAFNDEILYFSLKVAQGRLPG